MKWPLTAQHLLRPHRRGSSPPFVSTDRLARARRLGPVGGLRREACLGLGGGAAGWLTSSRETGEREGGGWLSLCDRTHLLPSWWNIPAVCGRQRCRWGGGVMTHLPPQALDSPSIAVRSGMSHIDAITSDFNPEVFLVQA